MQEEVEQREFVEQCCLRWEAELKAFLLGVLRSHETVEDAYQRTVLQALRAADSVHPDTVRGWLFRIALNEARQIRRSRKRLIRNAEDAELAELTDGTQPSVAEKSLIEQEFVDALARAIERLPPGQQEVIQLRLLERKPFAAIARELDRPLGTVLTWMRRGLERLRQDTDLKPHGTND